MNRTSAARQLKNRKRITHAYFGENEWIKLKGSDLVDENGEVIGTIESFIEGADMAYEFDWKLYKI